LSFILLEAIVKKMINAITALFRLVAATAQEMSSTLDNVNTAWREGKALENFQVTLNDLPEIGTGVKTSVDDNSIGVRSNRVNVVIVTETAPSRFTLFKIKRTINTANNRFGTRLTARIIQRPVSAGML
jgi:hypothetical protein